MGTPQARSVRLAGHTATREHNVYHQVLCSVYHMFPRMLVIVLLRATTGALPRSARGSKQRVLVRETKKIRRKRARSRRAPRVLRAIGCSADTALPLRAAFGLGPCPGETETRLLLTMGWALVTMRGLVVDDANELLRVMPGSIASACDGVSAMVSGEGSVGPPMPEVLRVRRLSKLRFARF